MHLHTCMHTIHTHTHTHTHAHTHAHTHTRTRMHAHVAHTVLPRCYALLAVTPCSLLRTRPPAPPPIFWRVGLFYLHYTPPPAGRSSRFAAR